MSTSPKWHVYIDDKVQSNITPNYKSSCSTYAISYDGFCFSKKYLPWCEYLDGINGIGSLQWRHNGLDGLSNHQSHHCLFSRLFVSRSKKTSKLRITGLCTGNSPRTGEFPAQRPVTRSFDVFFDLRLNKRLSKQSWGWWFETPSLPLWRHCNVYWVPMDKTSLMV